MLRRSRGDSSQDWARIATHSDPLRPGSNITRPLEQPSCGSCPYPATDPRSSALNDENDGVRPGQSRTERHVGADSASPSLLGDALRTVTKRSSLPVLPPIGPRRDLRLSEFKSGGRWSRSAYESSCRSQRDGAGPIALPAVIRPRRLEGHSAVGAPSWAPPRRRRSRAGARRTLSHQHHE